MQMQRSSGGAASAARPQSAPSSRWPSHDVSGGQGHSRVAANVSMKAESRARSRPQTARPISPSPSTSALVTRGGVSGGLTAPGPSMKSVDFEFSAELDSLPHNEPRSTGQRRRPQTAGASRASRVSHATRATTAPRMLVSRPATATTRRADRPRTAGTMKRTSLSRTTDAGGSGSAEADAWRPSYGPLSRSTRNIHARPQHAANRTWAAWTGGNKGEPPKAGGGWRYREASHRTAPRVRHTYRPKVRSSAQ